MTGQRIQQEAICYQWFKQRLILSVSEPSISQRSQIKEDTVEPSVAALKFNLKAYAAITWHNDPASLGLEPRLADHPSQAARTETLPTAPPGQAYRLLSYGQRRFLIWRPSVILNFKNVSIGAIFNDLERSITPISRSFQCATLKYVISSTRYLNHCTIGKLSMGQ